MRNDFCTGYLAHSAKGKEWQKHKYVAKVKLANGKYFYFYNLAQYQSYLKRRGDTERKKVDEKAKAELAGKDATLKKGVNSKEAASTAKTGSMTPEERRAAAIERVKGATGSSSSKKSGKSKSSSSSKKSTKSGSGKSSSSKSSSSKSSKGSSSKEKSSSGSSSKKSSEAKAKTTSTKQEQQTQQAQNTEQEVKATPSLSSYKYKYDLKDDDINTYSGAESDRVSTNRVQEIIDDMVDKYPDDSSGYMLSSFSDSITYQFKWVKEGGTIKLIDPDTGNEVPADVSLTNSKSISLFRTDNKQKKS